MSTRCVIPACGRDNSKGANGMCGMHSQRVKRTGTPGNAAANREPHRTIEERIFSRLVEDSDTGCWNWQGALRNGYGAVGIGQSLAYVHRWTYELFVGDVPAGLVIDHLCVNRRCANPEHLEAVTRHENNVRGGLSHGLRQAVAA